jgi:hypothetical protein
VLERAHDARHRDPLAVYNPELVAAIGTGLREPFAALAGRSSERTAGSSIRESFEGGGVNLTHRRWLPALLLFSRVASCERQE